MKRFGGNGRGKAKAVSTMAASLSKATTHPEGTTTQQEDPRGCTSKKSCSVSENALIVENKLIASDDEKFVEEGPIYYFGYGAMVNPIARERRGVCTEEAHAALLPNYRLSFTNNGVANIHPKAGWEVYGIVMKCASLEDWKILEAFSAGYDCIEVDVFSVKEKAPKREAGSTRVKDSWNCSSSLAESEDSDECCAEGSKNTPSSGEIIRTESCSIGEEEDGFAQVIKKPIRARVFVMPVKKQEGMGCSTRSTSDEDSKLPQERYLRVIASGMTAYGVDQDYINDEILGAAFIPSRKPEHYLQFLTTKANRTPPSISPVVWNKEYEQRMAKASKSTRATDKNLILFRLGEHAIQVRGEDASPETPFCVWLRDRLQGPADSTWVVVQTLYDPDLPLIATAEEVTSVHQAWAENQMMEKFEQAGVSATVLFHVPLDESGTRAGGGILKMLQSSFRSLSASSNSDHRTTSSSHGEKQATSVGSHQVPRSRSMDASQKSTKSKHAWSPKRIKMRVQKMRSKMPHLRGSTSSCPNKPSSPMRKDKSPLSQSYSQTVDHSMTGYSATDHNDHDRCAGLGVSMGTDRDPKLTFATLVEPSSDHFCAISVGNKEGLADDDSDSHHCCRPHDHLPGPPIANLTFPSE